MSNLQNKNLKEYELKMNIIKPLIETEYFQDLQLNHARITRFINNNQIICNILKEDEEGNLVDFSINRVFMDYDNNIDLDGMTVTQFIEYVNQHPEQFKDDTVQNEFVVDQNNQIDQEEQIVQTEQFEDNIVQEDI